MYCFLQADGPEELEYPSIGEGAGQFSSVWGHGQCPCASEDEHATGICLPADSSRFFEGGPVVGGIGRKPVWGAEYIKKKNGALRGVYISTLLYLLFPTTEKV